MIDQALIRKRWLNRGLLLAAAFVLAATAGSAAQAAEPTHDSQGALLLAQADGKAAADDEDAEHPFERRMPAPSLDGGLGWLNTAGPIDLRDLRGKFVLLDFWTYCCINCIHVLPELKKLERAYPNELVVIGVHSAKFETEQESDNIQQAILRYEIEHPVVNDANHAIWQRYQVNSWPSIRLIDPEGNLVAGHSGEFTFEMLDQFFQGVLPYYRQRGLLDETPLHFDLERYAATQTPLRFPGKILADEEGDRLFIADSNHNRIVIARLDGTLLETIGTGEIGRQDGGYDEATFDHPQGMALKDETLYVADTENHLLRKVDLQAKQVTTIAGTGVQSRNPWPGLVALGAGPITRADLPKRYVGPPKTTPLNSPWDLWIHGERMYIAMAGPHQIWFMNLDESEIGPYAGNGREDIVDGPLLPKEPYATGFSSFAQPSGLASDGEWLYVADSEGSSIRAVPFDSRKRVNTVVGTSHLRGARLFTFGDVDGRGREVRLQHPLCVAYHDGQLFVADTYNHKVKVIDLKTKETRTVAGTGEAGATDDPPTFHEPAGLALAAGKLYVADTNNHRIRTIDLADNTVSTLEIAGLEPPPPPQPKPVSRFSAARRIELPGQQVKADQRTLRLNVALQLPPGYKINELAPMSYLLEADGTDGPLDRGAMGEPVRLDKPSRTFEIAIPLKSAQGTDRVTVSLAYYYCQEGGEGLCKMDTVAWELPIELREDAASTAVELQARTER